MTTTLAQPAPLLYRASIIACPGAFAVEVIDGDDEIRMEACAARIEQVVETKLVRIPRELFAVADGTQR